MCKTDSAGKALSVMVMISDKCPECGADHIDVQSLTFAKVGRGDCGGLPGGWGAAAGECVLMAACARDVMHPSC